MPADDRPPSLDFWYDLASTYSYLAAMRIEARAAAARVAVRWRPFLLGPIFAAQGWTSSPFTLFPNKGRHMWRDMERLAAAHGLPPVRMPQPFPQNGLLAARLALALPESARPAFTRAVYQAEFAEGRSLDQATLTEILARMGEDAAGLSARAQSDDIKASLRAETGRAQELGIFGAPSFVTWDGELFWGNDRLEQALDWAAGRARRPAAA